MEAPYTVYQLVDGIIDNQSHHDDIIELLHLDYANFRLALEVVKIRHSGFWPA
jgi:hypothetical protein